MSYKIAEYQATLVRIVFLTIMYSFINVSIGGTESTSPNVKKYSGDKKQEIVINSKPVKKNAATSKVVGKHPSEKTLIKYLELDTGGAQLTTVGRVKLSKLTIDVFHEQSTIVTHVITGYKIAEKNIKENEAIYFVDFEYIGVMAEDFYKFKPRIKTETIKIILVSDKNGEWIIQTGLPPIMKADVVLDYLEQIRQGAYKKSHYVKEIDKINKILKKQKEINRGASSN